MLKANLILDLGNSETRAIVRLGDLSEGTLVEHAFTLSNSFAVVYDEYPKSEDYNSENTAIFSTKRVPIGKATLEEGTYVNGLMCAREFEKFEFSPMAEWEKYSSDTTVLSVFTAILRAGEFVQEYFKEKQNTDHNLTFVLNNVDWSVSILLPPFQVKKGEDELKKSLIGKFNVVYQMPQASAIINISNVTVYSEGIMAYMSVLLQRSTKRIRANKKFMTRSKVLVIDIGAGTTDIILVDKGVPVENSKFTIKTGGNNVSARLRQKINATLGLELPKEYYKEASVTGVIKQGTKEFDITEDLITVKREIAQLLNNEIQDYLESASISIRTVEYILVVGGGSIDSSASKVSPISEYILKGLQRYSPSMNLVDLTDMTTQEDEGDEELTLGEQDVDMIHPRQLNVSGVSVTLDLNDLKAKKEKETSNV